MLFEREGPDATGDTRALGGQSAASATTSSRLALLDAMTIVQNRQIDICLLAKNESWRRTTANHPQCDRVCVSVCSVRVRQAEPPPATPTPASLAQSDGQARSRPASPLFTDFQIRESHRVASRFHAAVPRRSLPPTRSSTGLGCRCGDTPSGQCRAGACSRGNARSPYETRYQTSAGSSP